MGVRPSTGTVGDAYDNAMAGSFFATLECELIARRITPAQEWYSSYAYDQSAPIVTTASTI